MKHRSGVWGVVVGLVSAAACAPTIREPGDEPVAQGGTSSGASGGRSSPTGPGSGGEAGYGGVPTEPECFSPTQRLDLAREVGGVGCTCSGARSVCVSDEDSSEPWSGQLDCVDGRWKSVPSKCHEDCFSPTNRPDLAVEAGAIGCACRDSPECVLTEYDGQPWLISFECEDERWISVEDGVCGDGTQAYCRSEGVTYPHGARHIPSPFDCNECECDNGTLGCTEAYCFKGQQECPQGTTLIRRCVECGGRMGECAVVETGCFTEQECPDGDCSVVCY